MKLIDSILLAVVLMASLCCLVTADLDRESCKKLVADPNANWETASQVIECNEKLYSDQITNIVSVVRNSRDESNCVRKPGLIGHRLFYGKSDTASIKRGIIAYGLRLSASCRNDMIKVVSSQLDGILTDEDFAPLARWTSDDSPLAKLFALDKENKGLALPSAMVKLLKARGSQFGGLLSMRVPVNSSFVRVKTICQRRFQPVYHRIIDPLIDLAMTGFNYEPETSATDSETVRKVQRMYRAVFVCKFLEKIKVTEDSNLRPGQVRMNEDVANLNELLVYPWIYSEIEQVKFDHELVDERQATGNDQLVDVNDLELMKAIQKYHLPKSHLGLKTSIKITDSSLAQELSNTRKVDNKDDDEDAAVANFFVRYLDKLSSIRAADKRKKAVKKVSNVVVPVFKFVHKYIV